MAWPTPSAWLGASATDRRAADGKVEPASYALTAPADRLALRPRPTTGHRRTIPAAASRRRWLRDPAPTRVTGPGGPPDRGARTHPQAHGPLHARRQRRGHRHGPRPRPAWLSGAARKRRHQALAADRPP